MIYILKVSVYKGPSINEFCDIRYHLADKLKTPVVICNLKDTRLKIKAIRYLLTLSYKVFLVFMALLVYSELSGAYPQIWHIEFHDHDKI
ncbi:hypothetical protein BpHYR1_032678 [Brachionus plicatilis]|uniref:Uncharacterized protein n=1 Tax=Brachionus plicatilis TaxID=10195 RepID=A0A3M7PTJ5_BRAPC|nr:hypothetical protein BpHYR1_032678 [Brachionus plicatilis]